MSILLNAEHLQALAQLAPELRDALARAALPPAQMRALHALLDDLSPLSTDLITEARHLRRLLETIDTEADADAAEPPALRSYGT